MLKKFTKPTDLPKEALDIYLRVFNASISGGENVKTASVKAFNTVKKGWKKENDKWVKKTTSEMKIPHIFRGSITDLNSIPENELIKKTSVIEILKVGQWDHPIYGEFEITPERLQRFKLNFYSGLRKGLPIDVEHRKDEGAYGWITNVMLDDEEDPTKLMGEVEWTDEGVQLIRSKKYRFFSPEISDEYEDYATGAEYKDVLMGGGITNRPFFQELEEIVLSENMIKKLSENEDMVKCTTCDKIIKKDRMDKHMQKHHPDKTMKGGENNTMDKKQLKEALVKDINFVPTDDSGVSVSMFAEVKAEVEKEAKEAKDAADKAKKNKEGGDKTKTAREPKGEKTVMLSENQFSDLQKAAQAGVTALKQLREKTMSETVKSFVYSENNKDGVLLPKSEELAAKLMNRMSDKTQLIFKEFLNSLPKIKVFAELGSSEVADELGEAPEGVSTYSFKLDKLAKELVSTEKAKTYSDAAVMAEKQLKEQGVTPDSE